MDILKAGESHFRALMDEYAFNINLCVQDPSREGSLDKLISAVNRYNSAKYGYETIIAVKNQMQSMAQSQDSDKNEG